MLCASNLGLTLHLCNPALLGPLLSAPRDVRTQVNALNAHAVPVKWRNATGQNHNNAGGGRDEVGKALAIYLEIKNSTSHFQPSPD